MSQELQCNFLTCPGVEFPLTSVGSTVCGSEIIRFAPESRKGRAVWPFLRPLQHPLLPGDSGRAKGNLDNLLRLAPCLSLLRSMLGTPAQLPEAPGRFLDNHEASGRAQSAA